MKHITTTHTTVQCNPGSNFHSGLLEAASLALSTNQKIHYRHNDCTWLIDPSEVINRLIDSQVPPSVEREVKSFMEGEPTRADRIEMLKKILSYFPPEDIESL